MSDTKNSRAESVIAMINSQLGTKEAIRKKNAFGMYSLNDCDVADYANDLILTGIRNGLKEADHIFVGFMCTYGEQKNDIRKFNEGPTFEELLGKYVYSCADTSDTTKMTVEKLIMSDIDNDGVFAATLANMAMRMKKNGAPLNQMNYVKFYNDLYYWNDNTKKHWIKAILNTTKNSAEAVSTQEE